MSRVFHRVLDRELPVAVRTEGAWVEDASGRRYLDGSGGAIVVNVGHGDPELVRAASEHLARLDYVHGTMFTTEALEAYAEEVAPLLPLPDARIYPVSGGSEAVETALKLARAYHLARGEDRDVVLARRNSYHGNTLGALDASGREPLRAPYRPWLGRARHVSAAYEYRCPNPGHPEGCAAFYADELERAIEEAGPGRVAAFVAEPISGATLAAAAPCEDYWARIAEVCRRHGVLLVADEVMTGFGRTGAWFAADHFGLRPDLLTAGKGATSGYVPFGFCAASGEVFEAVRAAGGFVHGFTWSHHGLGAAVGRAVLRRLREGRLVERSRELGERVRKELAAALADHPRVGEVRGRGLMIGIELVRDRATKEPFPREARATERVLAAGREAGLLLYPSTGHVGGRGDLLLLGPPFILSDEEAGLLVERTAAALDAVR